MNETIREQALLLGARDSLVGILTLPTVPPVATDVPTVVILNAGIIHRVGPNRLHVQLARLLASRGFPVLRFDLSGIGDSENRDDPLRPIEGAVADIREVLDELERTGRTRGVVLVGLCSGALHALLSAAADPRVVGLTLIDVQIPRTAQYYVRHYGRRVVRIQTWLNIMRGRHPKWRWLKHRLADPARGNEDMKAAALPALSQREIRAILERALPDVVERRVPLLAVFTAGMEEQHNYRGQLLDAFPRVSFGGLLRLEYFTHADHTFSAEAERDHLLRLVEHWIHTTGFPLSAAPNSSAPPQGRTALPGRRNEHPHAVAAAPRADRASAPSSSSRL